MGVIEKVSELRADSKAVIEFHKQIHGKWCSENKRQPVQRLRDREDTDGAGADRVKSQVVEGTTEVTGRLVSMGGIGLCSERSGSYARALSQGAAYPTGFERVTLAVMRRIECGGAKVETRSAESGVWRSPWKCATPISCCRERSRLGPSGHLTGFTPAFMFTPTSHSSCTLGTPWDASVGRLWLRASPEIWLRRSQQHYCLRLFLSNLASFLLSFPRCHPCVTV